MSDQTLTNFADILAENAALCAQIEELKAAWDEIANEFPGPHEGWLTDTPRTLMLRAVRDLKVRVEELTRERDAAREEFLEDTSYLERAEMAEIKLAERDRTIRAQDLHRQDLEARLAAVVEALRSAYWTASEQGTNS